MSTCSLTALVLSSSTSDDGGGDEEDCDEDMQDIMLAFCIYEFTSFYMIRTATAVWHNVMMMMTTTTTTMLTSYLVLLAEYETKETQRVTCHFCWNAYSTEQSIESDMP